jgi:hypothetical protein
MFSILEYIDYKKEQTIQFHGYALTQKQAVHDALQLAEQHRISGSFDHIFDNDVFINQYVRIEPTAQSKIIQEWCCGSFQRLSDEEIQEIIAHTGKEATVATLMHDCVGKIQCPSKYDALQNKRLVDQSMDTIREILEYLALTNDGRCAFGPDIAEKSSHVFAVVQVTGREHG